MTNREMYEAIINGNITDEVLTKCNENLAKLDERNKARASKPSKVQKENEPIKASILEVLTHEPMLTGDIVAVVGYTSNKIGALCRQLRDEGLVVESDIKVKGVGTRKAYALAEDGDNIAVCEVESLGENWDQFLISVGRTNVLPFLLLLTEHLFCCRPGGMLKN